jgi:hypothetical protein
MHIDQFIDDPKTDPYASWVLAQFRFPAILRGKCADLIEKHKLFCTYKNLRWRVTGASRMGDVWLAKDHNQAIAYDERADVAECHSWDDKP